MKKEIAFGEGRLKVGVVRENKKREGEQIG